MDFGRDLVGWLVDLFVVVVVGLCFFKECPWFAQQEVLKVICALWEESLPVISLINKLIICSLCPLLPLEGSTNNCIKVKFDDMFVRYMLDFLKKWYVHCYSLFTVSAFFLLHAAVCVSVTFFIYVAPFLISFPLNFSLVYCLSVFCEPGAMGTQEPRLPPTPSNSICIPILLFVGVLGCFFFLMEKCMEELENGQWAVGVVIYQGLSFRAECVITSLTIDQFMSKICNMHLVFAHKAKH